MTIWFLLVSTSNAQVLLTTVSSGPVECLAHLVLVRYLGEGNGTPLQDSRLENPMDVGAW